MSALQAIKEQMSLRRWRGPLTEKLVQKPSSFGLGKLPERLQPDQLVKSICGYCSTGCSLQVHMRDGKPVNLSTDGDYPVNLGMACPKGWEALTPLSAEDRVTQPMLRNEAGELEPVSWEKALQVFCERGKQVQADHGKQALSFISTGQIPFEEMAFLGSLAKFGMGIEHGDGNTRQCMATAVVAYKQAFGFDAPPYTYKDFEESDVLFFVGANPCIAHPIMWQRVMRNRRNPKIIVVDPRRTETAMVATQHVALEPKSDLILFYGLARLVIESGKVNKEFVEAHTEGFAEFAEFVQEYTLEKVVEATGIAVDVLQGLAAEIVSGKRVSFWWTMGVNQSHEGVRLCQSMINLALMTGNIGKPGTGANSITGQCNAMGSRLFSNTTGLLGGHDFLNAEHRQKIAQSLGIPEENIPQKNSWAYNEIIDGIETGDTRGLWVICTNPAHSWIEQGRLRRLREKLDFLVVQDMYATTETAQIADLVLPVAGWGEKSGCFINSERRIGVIHPVAQAPGEAKSDFEIFQAIAQAWGCGEMFAEWTDPEAVFKKLAALTKGQPCDISGVESYQEIEALGGVQWPMPEKVETGSYEKERRLFADGKFYTPSGRAKFLFEDSRVSAEVPDVEFPLWLLTGRGTSSQWHTQTRTGKSDVLRKLYPQEVYVEISAREAESLGVVSGDMVAIESRRGQVRAAAYISPTVKAGQVFMSMHYPETNFLTLSQFDPYSKQPSYKACAVRLLPVNQF